QRDCLRLELRCERPSGFLGHPSLLPHPQGALGTVHQIGSRPLQALLQAVDEMEEADEGAGAPPAAAGEVSRLTHQSPERPRTSPDQVVEKGDATEGPAGPEARPPLLQEGWAPYLVALVAGACERRGRRPLPAAPFLVLSMA